MRCSKWIAITLSFVLGPQSSFLFAQDGPVSCAASNGAMTGPTLTCESGWCRYSVCATSPPAFLGDLCNDGSQCVGVQTSSGRVPECGALLGAEKTCGGDGVFCVADNGDASGNSPICSSGRCRNAACVSTDPVPLGQQCSEVWECEADVSCIEGFCSRAFLVCQASDGSKTGSLSGTDPCASGFCRNSFCAITPTANLGEACDQDSQCVNAGSWENSPAFCSESFRVCGGEAARCFADTGFDTGPSSVCASGCCRRYKCTSLNPPPPGGACEFDYNCGENAFGVGGVCSDLGLPCTAEDGSSTGSTTDCQAGFCRDNSCANYPPVEIGDSCIDSNQCVGVETYMDIAASCSGPEDGPLTCGGESGFCYSEDGKPSGATDVCASGRCRAYQCASLTARNDGEFCERDYQCQESSYCIRSSCRKTGDECHVEDGTGNAQNIGPSGDCASLFCRAGVCSKTPVATLGDPCDEDQDCSGSDGNTSFRTLLNCGTAEGNRRRCGSGGAPCVPLDGGMTGDAPDLCISGFCFQYFCSDAVNTPGFRRRNGVAAQKMIQPRPCPGRLHPCPLYPKGYECIDILNDIESCGGCVGRNMAGIDCSADVNAAEIDCIAGRCVISECNAGYVIAPENNTCVFS